MQCGFHEVVVTGLQLGGSVLRPKTVFHSPRQLNHSFRHRKASLAAGIFNLVSCDTVRRRNEV